MLRLLSIIESEHKMKKEDGTVGFEPPLFVNKGVIPKALTSGGGGYDCDGVS